jgi:aspartyl-tRNA(Asn)/glutamyl-tRNA(Gln) amidotransferase subunit B
MRKYTTIIGIEVHAELNTRTKAFCGCRNESGALPNTLVCPVCLGLPGAIPSVNRQAIEKTILTGLLLGSKISSRTMFERKNFFSPDMPKGYQLVQFSQPLCVGGSVSLSTGKTLKINRVHLEEDSAKLIHDDEFNYTLIDYNRSGVPVVEIVADPMELTTDEVVECLNSLKRTLIFGGVSDCLVEKGGYRFDVNISVSPKGAESLGTRVELKNLATSKHVRSAIEYEVNRHISILETGGIVKQETRVWSEDMEKTYIVRPKENFNDYRHLADPDIKTIEISNEDIERLRKLIPETFESKVNRYRKLGLNQKQIEILTSEKYICDYFDKAVILLNEPNKIVSWISNEILRVFKEHNRVGFDSLISPENLVGIIKLEMEGQISSSNAKVLFDEVVSTGKNVDVLVKELGIAGRVSDSEIDSVVDSIIAGNMDIISDFRNNPTNVMNYFVGKVKTMTGGRANAETVRNLTSDKLNKK